MAYKTAEQILNYILENSLLTDTCMTLFEGRNEFGFRATAIPHDSVKHIGNGRFRILLHDPSDGDFEVPVTVDNKDKFVSFWLISFNPENSEVAAVMCDKGDYSERELEQKMYLAVILMFLDHYKINTTGKILSILKRGYKQLKEEIHDENNFELLRDQMNAGIAVARMDHLTNKVNVRFNFEV